MSELSNVESTVGKVGGQILSMAEAPGLFERYAVFVLVGIAAIAISFGAGYLYRAHRDEVKSAGAAATIETAQAVGTAVVAQQDTHTDTKLQARLSAANARATSLQNQIELARHANPATSDCTLPVSLRDQLNADLATDPGQVQGPLR